MCKPGCPACSTSGSGVALVGVVVTAAITGAAAHAVTAEAAAIGEAARVAFTAVYTVIAFALLALAWLLGAFRSKPALHARYACVQVMRAAARAPGRAAGALAPGRAAVPAIEARQGAGGWDPPAVSPAVSPAPHVPRPAPPAASAGDTAGDTAVLDGVVLAEDEVTELFRVLGRGEPAAWQRDMLARLLEARRP